MPVNTSPSECDHGVSFDEKAAQNLTTKEIRERWPRLAGECPKKCGFKGFAYASLEHFVYGDW